MTYSNPYESLHQVTWLFGDRGIPATWRHTNGYSSHTLSRYNEDGERYWVEFHLKTDQGIENFASDIEGVSHEGIQSRSVEHFYKADP